MHSLPEAGFNAFAYLLCLNVETFCLQVFTAYSNEKMFISRFINDSLQNMSVDRLTGETNFYVLLSDAAGNSLKVFYPHLIHVTCIIHGIHRISEEIRIYFANVNKLISTTKKVFLKAPLRTQANKENLPYVPLPPETVITRWSPWINAATVSEIHIDEYKASRAQMRSICLRLAKCRHDTLIQSKRKQQIAIFLQLYVTIRVTPALFFIRSRHFHFVLAIFLL